MQCDTQRDFLCEKPEIDTAATATATTTATAAAGACSCGAGWTGSLDTGRCYRRGAAPADYQAQSTHQGFTAQGGRLRLRKMIFFGLIGSNDSHP